MFTKQILEFNRQDLWATTILLKFFDKLNDINKAKLVISQSSDFGELVKSKDFNKTDDCLSLVQSINFPEDVIEFLKIIARTAENDKNINNAMQYHLLIIQGCFNNRVERAKSVYKIGRFFHQLGKLSEAKEAYIESANLGKGQFNLPKKAVEPLRAVKVSTNVIPSLSQYDLSKLQIPCKERYFLIQKDQEDLNYVDEKVRDQLLRIKINSEKKG